MNKIRIKKMIQCNTCGDNLKRVKTIKVQAESLHEANAEAKAKIEKWIESLKGQNCKTCQSVIDDLAE